MELEASHMDEIFPGNEKEPFLKYVKTLAGIRFQGPVSCNLKNSLY